MDGYRRRIVDDELDELAPRLAALALEGPKAVGKTETALRRSATVYRLDDPAVAEIARADPSRVVVGARPVLIDEWQRFPPTWDVVRRAVDADSTGGQFLLTGSATPPGAPTHSGAGRIATLRMRPLSLAERDLGPVSVRLADLLSGSRPQLHGESTLRVADYAYEVVASGFPGLRGLSGRALRSALDGYLHRIVEHDIDELGARVRNPGALRRWMTAYAAATSSTAAFETIRDAASAADSTPARSTTIPYRRILEQLWIIEDLPAWSASRNRLRRLGESPRHHLADPALAARLLGVDADALLDGADPSHLVPRDGSLLGALFESLVALSVRVYGQADEATVSHLRTRGGEHEVDLIVERSDGRVVALEVKLSRSVSDTDVRHLTWLASQLGTDLLDAAVITTGPEAYRRGDGIAVIPAGLLGP